MIEFCFRRFVSDSLVLLDVASLQQHAGYFMMLCVTA